MVHQRPHSGRRPPVMCVCVCVLGGVGGAAWFCVSKVDCHADKFGVCQGMAVEVLMVVRMVAMVVVVAVVAVVAVVNAVVKVVVVVVLVGGGGGFRWW
jgi:hypothetical protein